MKIWLDDVRKKPAGFDIRVRTAKELLEILRTKPVSFISFDHDLGDEFATGYTVACFIELRAQDGFQPPEWAVHSSNPVGAKRIEAAMRSAHRIYKQRKEEEKKAYLDLVEMYIGVLDDIHSLFDKKEEL